MSFHDGILLDAASLNIAFDAKADKVNPAITGGTVDGTVIGGTTPAAARFTTVSADKQITSTVATGTAPFAVSSTTPVTNLNIGGNAATATSAVNATTASSVIGSTWEIPGPYGTVKASFGSLSTNTIATLKTCSKTGPQVIRTLGYSIVGIGGANYYLDSSDTTSADNGCTIIVAADGGRWKMLFPSGRWEISVEQAGGMAGADISAALQKALDAMPASGGAIYCLGGSYNLSAQVVIGNGNGGSTASTKKGIRIIGTGAAFAAGSPPTQFTYTGASVADYLFKIAGQISDVEISGILFYLNGNIGGISATSISGSNIHNLKIVNPRSNTCGLYVTGGTAPTGNYNIFNKFSQISIALISAASTGLYFDGDYASINDTWLTTFDLVRVDVVAGATNSACARLRFIDSCTFNRCHFVAKNEATASGLVLDATNNPGGGNNYPIGLAFYDCSITSTTVLETGTQFIGNCYFIGAGVNDNEVIPTHPRLLGITANGEAFGGMVGFKDRKNTDSNVQNTTTNTSVYSYSAGAYFLGGGVGGRSTKGGFRVTHFANYVNASGSAANLTLTVSFGGVSLFSIPFTAIPSGASARSIQLDFTMHLGSNSTSIEIGQARCTIGAVGSVTGTAAAAFSELVCTNSSSGLTVDTSTAKTLDISVQHGTANGSIAYTAKETLLELV